MRKIAEIFAILTFIFVVAIAANAQTDWVGVYEFGEDGGKTTGGSAVFITHQIEIRETDDGFLAMIISNGYQTARDLVCTLKTDGDKISFYFDSYGENNSIESYTEGDLLLTLERKTTKNKTEILTFWEKFKPVIAANETSGKVYFKKIPVKINKN